MRELFQQIRKSMGMNQSEFARALGITPQMVSHIETGKRQPGRQTIAGLFAVANAQQRQQLQDALLEASGVKVLHPTRGGKRK